MSTLHKTIIFDYNHLNFKHILIHRKVKFQFIIRKNQEMIFLKIRIKKLSH